MEVALGVSLRNTNQRRSFSSEDDTESIHSVQAKETDVVQDTHSDEYGDFSSASTLELEYEVATSDSDDTTDAHYEVLLGTGADGVTSSGEDDIHMNAAIAAALCDTSLEAWATDCEDSDTTAYNDSMSSAASTGARGADFWTCLQCNGRNDQPQVRYCDKCFQRCWQCKTRKLYNCFPLCNGCYKVRKNLFPPRPRGTRKRKLERQAAEEAQTTRKRRASNAGDEPSVKLTALQHCLSGLSQDSGLGSSQEIPRLNFDKIIMPMILSKLRGVKRARTDSTNGSDSDADDCTVRKQVKLDVEATVVSQLPSTSRAIIVNTAIELSNATVKTCGVVASTEIVLDPKSVGVVSSTAADCITTSSKKHSNISTDFSVASSSSTAVHSERCSLTVSQRLVELDSTGQTESSEFERDVAVAVKQTANGNGVKIQATNSVDVCAKGETTTAAFNDLRELCMICNESAKNAIFLHGKIAHLCCCYKCAMKTWRISKRCPMCNCKVKNVVKVYST